MTYSENDNALVEELLKSIQSTTSLIQGLMAEMKGNATALATLETKLESLSENAKSLSKIVRDDNGNKSVLTRMALVEKDLEDLYANYKEFKIHVYKKLEETKELISESSQTIRAEIKTISSKEEEKENFSKKKMLAMLQMSPGVIALILVLIKIIWGIDIGL